MEIRGGGPEIMDRTPTVKYRCKAHSFRLEFSSPVQHYREGFGGCLNGVEQKPLAIQGDIPSPTIHGRSTLNAGCRCLEQRFEFPLNSPSVTSTAISFPSKDR
jgi:hypothetical protein